MSTPAAPFYQLRCGCNQYPWGKQGSDSLAARLCAKTPGWDGKDKKNFQIDEKTPYAEMWMGTYPVLPSYVANTGEDLQDVLNRYPKELLGDKVTSKFGHTKLPYLPKVLSIAKALPLQVHPNKEFSSKKHKEDPDSFTDGNHKPEIALALTEFEAFCGFKPVEAIVDVLRHKPLRHFLVAGGATVADEKLSQEGLRQVVKAILKSSDEDIKKAFQAIRELPDSAFAGLNSAIPEVAKKLENQFPTTDPGNLVALLCMNYMLLQPGEVIYIPAGGIHAYISGDIIECMARSDNVLNTGFCPKADRDNVDEFCSVLEWEPTTKTQTILQAQAYSGSKEGRTNIFRPPTSEFNVLATELGAGEREVLGEGGPAIMLATRGSATVKASGEMFELAEGNVYFVAQGVKLDISAGDKGLLLHTAFDFFRHNVGAQPPLACFLSHVHSDHLAGLDSLRSPFVYCSAATREILLRLERYPCRINYAKGILEARQQTYKHLNKVLKSLPLETPTTIELRPGLEIQVTLFDANHCPGATMFRNNQAILYTGDIRSEPWFVNTMSRNPNLVEYTAGLKTLDKIYLDTSFIEDVPFQTKSQGIAELLRKVSKYPSDTVFHLQAWTYGYEEVWVALSKALKSRIHVDDYKLRIYGSLKSRPSEARFGPDVHLTPESPALTGHMCGNTPHPGCLTADENVRLHSCERGNMCEVARRPSTVTIQPVIAHLSTGQDLAEVGVGGGGDDLQREAELESLDQTNLATLVEMVLSSSAISTETLQALKEVLSQAVSTGRNISLDWDIESLGKHSAQEVVLMLAEKLGKGIKNALAQGNPDQANLPKTIRFPYSRHSSYPELCHFVEAFRPRDVWPCTVNPTEWLRNGTSIRSLFGQFCSGEALTHDIAMKAFAERNALDDPAHQHDSQTTVNSPPPPSSPIDAPQDIHPPSDPLSASRGGKSHSLYSVPERFLSLLPETQASIHEEGPSQTNNGVQTEQESRSHESSPSSSQVHLGDPRLSSPRRKRSFHDFTGGDQGDVRQDAPSHAGDSFNSTTSLQESATRQDAYLQMLQNITTDSWAPVQLISTSSEYTTAEQEL
ncbi:hypothetical protein FZEAL_6771 [Fusarium zealandicum]|uniref:Mannose-6-phosphate isomerase n=1 Tax=Fusarium zealandicum TaxID=1053134 RepID=A0A8H4XIJ6_9HYPO|nr:hypothetical protein FZEAL_6771 [Fusarium zealandicum]